MVILELQETLNRVSLGLIINTFKPKLHCKVLHFSDIGSNYQDNDICDI